MAKSARPTPTAAQTMRDRRTAALRRGLPRLGSARSDTEGRMLSRLRAVSVGGRGICGPRHTTRPVGGDAPGRDGVAPELGTPLGGSELVLGATDAGEGGAAGSRSPSR